MKCFKNLGFWANLTLWMVGFLLLGLLFPSTIRDIENQNQILGSGDFIADTLYKPGGILSIASTWLKQWFVYPWAGAFVYMTLILICSLAIWHALKTCSMKAASIMGVFASVAVLILGFPDFNGILQSDVALICLAGYLALRRRAEHPWISLIFLLFVPLLDVKTLVILYISVLLSDLFFSKKWRSWIFSAIGLAGSICLSQLWSRHIQFLSQVEGEPFQASNIATFIILLVPVCLVISKLFKIKIANGYCKLETFAHLILVISAPVYFYFLDNYRKETEKLYSVVQAAEANKWSRVMEITHKGSTHYPSAYNNELYLKYTLLAANESGILGDVLFRYPVNTTSDMFFWRNSQDYACLFNALFYKSLNLPDEYMHQIFELGSSERGMTARCIRHLTEAAIMQQNKALAEKWFYIAQKSQKDKEWTDRISLEINRLTNASIEQNKQKTPERSDFFIGAYEPKSELTYIAMNDSNNVKRVNLMLSSFLLEKDLQRFSLGIRLHKKLFAHKMPQSFKEAYIFIQSSNTTRDNETFDIAEEQIKKYIHFMNLLNKDNLQEIERLYRYTYWYYLFFVDKKQ